MKAKRRQSPIKGGRTPLPSCVEVKIWAAVDKMAVRYHVSRSFVIATALADQFRIEVQEHYYGDGKSGAHFKAGDRQMNWRRVVACWLFGHPHGHHLFTWAQAGVGAFFHYRCTYCGREYTVEVE